MKRLLSAIGRRALFRLDPETAHRAAIAALKRGLMPKIRPRPDPRLATTVAGLAFAHPLGMAAGFDKNAEAVPALFGLGFAAVEIGSVTPKPQAGNPSPRLFRLEESGAIINRMGFNNDGHTAVLARLTGKAHAGILGVNIGANKDGADRIGDYVAGITTFSPVADYFTVNVSSPNTPGLRDLQSRGSLDELFDRLIIERGGLTVHRPIFVKIAPDLTESELDAIAAACSDKGIDGVVVSNTTVSRSGVAGAQRAEEAGGLSGRPLFDSSTIVLAKMRERLGPAMPIIGVGGVEDGRTAAEKIRAGADLVQLYTGFIYGGPSLPARIVRELSALCDAEGLSRLVDLRDSRTADYAARPIPA